MGLVSLCGWSGAGTNGAGLVGLAAAALLVVVALVRPGVRGARVEWWSVCGVLLVSVLASALVLVSSFQTSGRLGTDVLVFQDDAARALVRGDNPYALTFPDIYAPEASRLYYGEGLSVDGRLQFGYPYPPLLLVPALAGLLLGDPRLVAVLMTLVAVGLLLRLSSDGVSRLTALAVAVSPLTVSVLVVGWVEPALALVLVLLVTSVRRGGGVTPYLLGLLLVSKQYVVVALPLVLLLASRGDAGRTAGATRGAVVFLVKVAGTGAATILPFLLWDPAGFWRSVVALQFQQPFREDAQSLLVWAVTNLGWPPPSVSGWLPLAAGLLTACACAWRAPRSAAGFAASLGLTLLVTVLLSKQAFTNYYFFVLVCLVAAVCAARPRQASPAVKTVRPEEAAPPEQAARTGHSRGGGRVQEEPDQAGRFFSASPSSSHSS